MTTPEAPEGACLIELRRRTGPSLWAIVDEADYEDVSRLRWWASWKGLAFYAQTSTRRDGRSATSLLHRYLTPDAECVDHINGDTLDNRRTNLRATTTAENGRNRQGRRAGASGFLGVTPDRGRWRAQVFAEGRSSRPRVHSSHHASPVAAAIARDLAALEADPVHYALNFPGLRRPLPIIPR